MKNDKVKRLLYQSIEVIWGANLAWVGKSGNILISPIWLPIRLTNLHLIKSDLLDIFSGDCFFYRQEGLNIIGD